MLDDLLNIVEESGKSATLKISLKNITHNKEEWKSLYFVLWYTITFDEYVQDYILSNNNIKILWR